MREIKFAANNDEAIFLFTGRTKDLEEIFRYILNKKCIALYGERRSGKTYTLLIIEQILNKNIDLNKLIDRKLSSSIEQNWLKQLTNFEAIYISFLGIASEEQLAHEFRGKSKHLFNDEPPVKLSELLEELQKKFLKSNSKLVFLLDEMEILGKFEDQGLAVAGLFCNRIKYSSILFIHTGSYLWQTRVSSPGSLFTHLSPYYLKGIDKSDMVQFLLEPLSNQHMKEFIVNMSGCKPLYAQFIGESIDKHKQIISSEQLLKDKSLSVTIERCIYREASLDENSKKILELLAHRNSTCRKIVEKLNLSPGDTRSILDKLENFGTIQKVGKSYEIVGKIIEEFGKNNYDNPFVKSRKETLMLISRLTITVILIGVITGISFYINPSSTRRRFNFPDGMIIIDIPNSLEIKEEGKLNITVVNNSKTSSIKYLKIIFESVDNNIIYTKDKKNIVSFYDIQPRINISEAINFLVDESDNNLLRSKITTSIQRVNNNIASKNTIITQDFGIKRRRIPIKRYSIFLNPFLALLASGFAFPKQWTASFTFFQQVLSGGNKSSVSDSKENKDSEPNKKT